MARVSSIEHKWVSFHYRRGHKFHLLLIFSLITFIFLPIYSEAIKIASWNILNFPGSTGTSREDDFRRVIDQLNLDILVVQEMLSPAGVDQFLNNVMNYSSPGTYEAVPFFDGPDTDNALFYKKSVIRLISYQQIPTALRDISEYWLEIIEGPGKGIEFIIYSVHLKAGTSTDDKIKRKNEATILRNHLNGLLPNTLFLVGGDFNMRSSEERAFELLTESQADNDGRTKDPINKLGYWHDNEEFADIHTQSTRTTQFGGGATGGLDDRFDLILNSYGFDESEGLIYKLGSYIAYGNDGKHFNKAINEGVNGVVSDEVADALHEASDHLPVIIELVPPSEYTPVLSITAGTGGTTDPAPGSYTYDSGTEVTITAIPESGYRFSEWSGDASGTDNPITITMDSDKSITANFIRQYTLTIGASEGGTTDPSPGTHIYDTGIEVTITATPDSGCRFTGWTGDASGESNPITITMDSDKSITANFIRQYTLTISAGTGGTTNPSPGTYTHDSGTEVSISATPNSGYTFANWTGDVPTGQEKNNPLTVTIDSDKSVKANFNKRPTDDGGKGGCFIATACFETPLAEEVKILCDFRDRYLMTNPIGRDFIKFYYKHSPKIAEFIRNKEPLKRIIRECLKPFIWIIDNLMRRVEARNLTWPPDFKKRP